MQFSHVNHTEVNPIAWAKQFDQPGQNQKGIDVFIDPKELYQTFLGVGASFSELGYRALSALSEPDQDGLFKRLFDQAGANLNYCRMPIGASDFAFSAYSLNDHAGDMEMHEFSVDADKKCLIPFIKGAMKYRPNLKIHASPWSPPAWLKDNNSMTDGGQLKDASAKRAYAKYLVSFVEQYRCEGIDVFRLLLQNEPDSAACFPSCMMPPAEMSDFYLHYLRPEMRARRVDFEVFAGTFRGINSMWANDCARDHEFFEAIDGFGFQYCPTEKIYEFTRKYLGKPIMHTESVCYDGQNTSEQALSLFLDFIDYMNAGCEIYTYWNMILGKDSRSTWGWAQNSLVTVDEKTRSSQYNPDYKIVYLISHAIPSGATRTFSLCSSRRTVAFLKDDKVILLVANIDDEPVNVNIRIADQTLHAVLAPNSANALTLQSIDGHYSMCEE